MTNQDQSITTPAPEALKEKLRTNAELFRKITHDNMNVDIGYDIEAVRWLDGYIQRQHENSDPTEHRKITQVLGSFLGECIIHNIGGEWFHVDDNLVVRFDSRNWAFPFIKVLKHLENGAEAGDSVLGFYESVGVIFKNR